MPAVLAFVKRDAQSEAFAGQQSGADELTDGENIVHDAAVQALLASVELDVKLERIGEPCYQWVRRSA